MTHLINWLLDDDYKARLMWLTTKFTSDDFSGVDSIIMNYLYMCMYTNCKIKDSSLETYLTYNLRDFITQTEFQSDLLDEKIDYKNPLAIENVLPIISSIVKETIDSYVHLPKGDSFKSDVMIRLREIRKERAAQLTENAALSMDTNYQDKILEDINLQSHMIIEKFGESVLDDFSLISGEPEVHGENDNMVHLFNTGIKYIDSNVGGVYTTLLYTLTGMSKTGKTKFCIRHFAYQAILAGLDVAFFELEMSSSEIWNSLYAVHTNALSGGQTKISPTSIGRGLCDDIILPTKADLENPKYGQLHVFEYLNIEELENKFAMIAMNSKCKLVVIDLMGKIGSKIKSYKYKSQADIISEAYIILKRMARKYKVAVLAVNQFTKEGVEAMLNGKPFMQGYTEGGQATQRNTDYDMVMSMTHEQQAADRRKFEVNFSRISRVPESYTTMQVDLGTLRFREIAEE